MQDVGHDVSAAAERVHVLDLLRRAFVVDELEQHVAVLHVHGVQRHRTDLVAGVQFGK